MKIGKKILGITGAATIAASTALGGGVLVHAEDQISSGAEGIVAIHINGSDGGRDIQVVDYDFHGDDHGYTHAPDLGVYPQDVYCINPTRNPGADADKNQHFRWRWNLNANAWLFDNNRNILENTDYAPGSSQLAGLAAIINYGQTNGYSYGPIQNAVYWYVCFGNGSAPDYAGQQYQNEITDAYKNGEAKAPASYGLYMYIPDGEVTEMVQNTVGLAVWQQEEETTTTTEEETTTITEEETTTTTEEETTTTAEEETTTTTEDVTTDPTTIEDETNLGSLKTTVSIDGNSSSASKSVEVEAGTYNVDDTITYTDLTGGATYIVKGQLVCVDDETVIGTTEHNYPADDSGSGTWTVTFKNAKLEAGKKYVVYESAVNRDNAKDKAEHKDKSDKAQTVIVKEETQTTTSEEETTTSEEETTTSEEETTTTTTNKGELATTVDAAGKKGSAEKGAQITFDETKSITSIDDTIKYTNLVAGATYTVTGTLVEVNEYGKIVNPSVATNTLELVADAADGEWTMTFDVSNVDLNTYSKYVVFESAYTAGGEDENATQDNPITHENVKDMAQSIYTENEEGKIRPDIEEGEPTESKETTNSEETIPDDKQKGNADGGNNSGKKGSNGPNTGDSSNTALYITAAVAAAGIAVTAIALGTKKRSRRR